MIIVITNRKLETLADDQGNTIPVAEMGVVLAERNGNNPVIRTGLLQDNGQNIHFCARGDEQSIFDAIPEAELQRRWVFFVHGFHQDPDENIGKAMDLQNNHNVNVIVFAWPSRPSDETIGWEEEFKTVLRKYLMSGGNAAAILSALAVDQVKSFLKDRWRNYPAAIKNAEQSPVDLLAAMELVKTQLNSKYAPMLLVHSMGNYLLKMTLETAGRLPMKFTHIMLHQADVNSSPHQWVNQMQANLADDGKIYVTINAHDYVLASSSARRMLLRQKPSERLGQLRMGDAFNDNIAYLDFSDGPRIDKEHEFFRLKKGQTNPYVFDCLQRIFTGSDDGLPQQDGTSALGFSKMPTAITLYRLEEIIDPVDGAFGQYDNDVLVKSLDWFEDPLNPDEEPIDPFDMYND